MAKAKRTGGVSRQVRRVNLVTRTATPSTLVDRVVIEKVSTTLGFKARATARQQAKERLQEQYAGRYLLSHDIMYYTDDLAQHLTKVVGSS